MISASATLASPALPALTVVAVMISESGAMAIWPLWPSKDIPSCPYPGECTHSTVNWITEQDAISWVTVRRPVVVKWPHAGSG